MARVSENVRQAIRDFISPKFPDLQWQDHEDLFSFGLIDSLMAMEFVMFLERRFELSIPNEELDIRNFRTVDAMTALVERLTAAQHSDEVRS